ncbi:MAG: PAS domain-containing sensor histidine kinase [Elusimicrobia bacterium]|nr:PAS domain-containing sensor histidine kinase [Elusimicrobiota bacterium]
MTDYAGAAVPALAFLAGGGAGAYLVYGRLKEKYSRALAAVSKEKECSETALRESEDRYRSLFENMLNGFAYCRMLFDGDEPEDFEYLSVNKAFEALTGLKDVAGRKVSEVIPGIRESDPGLFERYGRVARTGKPETFETYVEALKMWFSISVFSPAKGHFAAVFDVITERKRAEETLRRSEAKFSAIFRLTPFAMSLAAPDGRQSDVNQAWLELTGFTSKEEVLGRTSLELGLIPDEEARERILNELRQKGSVRNAELGIRDKAGVQRLLLVSLEKMEADGREMILTLMQDITERRRAEETLKRTAADLRAKNKELEDLMYVASHDLRAPLVNIQGFADNLARYFRELHAALGGAVPGEAPGGRLDGFLNFKIPEALHFVAGSGARMDRLISAMLQVSRLGRLELHIERVDMDGLISDLRDTMAFQIREADAELRVGKLPPCRGDREQLSQVFANLLENSLKYRAPGRKPVIEITGKTGNGMMEYRVTDNGIGLTDEEAGSKIWAMFYRADPKGGVKGEGIGLTAARQIVERHGGKISAAGVPAGGAEFTVRLPC